RDHARQALVFSRRLSSGLLASFRTPEDWVFQIHPKANHALWIAAHIGLVDNSITNRFRSDLTTKPEGWDALFSFGSQPKADASVYPSAEEVLAYYHDRRGVLMRVLEELSERELRGPAPAADERSPIAGAPSIGHIFIFASQHEAMHSGQLTIAHRALGHAPLIQAG
ncbi:MAG TPA: DinB family protein, partial [Lacipirellula sp.]